MNPAIRRLLFWCTPLVLTASLSAQRGALTYPVNLTRLTDRAAVIVQGRIVSARVEPHPQLRNLHTVVVTMRVDDTWKGRTGQTYTFRQFIWDIRDRMDAAGYRKGEELLLFMNPVNSRQLTSPVGLNQGKFRVIRAQGETRVVNGQGNAGLFRDTSARLGRVQIDSRAAKLTTEHRSGPVEIGSLKQIVRALGSTRPGRTQR